RFKQTNLGQLIDHAMMAASPKTDAAILNSGSIRIDDKIEGNITELDIIRTLPFGGKLCEVELNGRLLNRMLNTSDSIKGLGGYLQVSDNISAHDKHWFINNTQIENNKIYHIVSPEFLFSGQEK